ncbi:Acylamino-acid-releasing enzyme, partial [Dufourea novaeangliae]
LARNPSLSCAKILRVTDNGISILSGWSQRNLERKTNQKFCQNYILDSKLQVQSENFPIDVTTELLSASTEDEQRRAVLRQAVVENSTKQFIEIWDKQRLVKNYDLTALDVHGDVYTDSEFASFEWSPDKTKILYIAEKKLPKSEPFYKQKPLNKKDKEKKEEDEVSVGNEYIYKAHWGEQLIGKHRPVVAVLDTTSDTISALSGIPDELSPAQVLWMKDNQGVVGVAWKHEPRHLEKLSSDGCAVRCPRLSPDGRYLIWLEREAGGAHHNAHRLMHFDFETGKQKADTLVDIVSTNIAIKNTEQFYGLYGRLPRRCWSNDSQYIFLSTPQQNNIRSYIIDISFAVVQVNYRGSTGMGSKNVEYLQGRVGDIDVKDCVTATKEALRRYPWLNPDEIGISGGSHGGFLVTHLSGQYPDLYKVVVARNPVIDIAAMFTISDIPDCRNALTKEEKIKCAAEVNYPFDESTRVTESDQVEMLVKMFKCSPIIHVGKVKAPTLLCIGSNDLRVPPSQGKLWYQRLKAKNVKTKMLLYEDNHPLASGPVEIDNVINACLWLHEHIT